MRVVSIVSALALVFGVAAGTASARTHSRTHYSAHQRKMIRKQLLRSIKKNPKLIRKASFLRKASLVDFKLPVTIRLRSSVPCGAALGYAPCNGTTVTSPQGTVFDNPNSATIDLGPSLGSREIDLGGSLPAEIVFHDSFDGGALGNVDINLLRDNRTGPGSDHLSSTSVPLLWNTQVSAAGTHWFESGGNSFAGCGDFKNQAASILGNFATDQYSLAPVDLTVNGSGGAQPDNDFAGFGGLPASLVVPNPAFTTANTITFPNTQLWTGAPFFASPASSIPSGLVDEYPGVDSIANITAGTGVNPALGATGFSVTNNTIGGNPDPFPYAPSAQPTGGPTAASPYNAQDVVLRTNALSLDVATTGNVVSGSSADGAGAQGTQTIVVGKSGGQANLFGNIPGKNTQVDVTVSLSTAISSILREVDPDPQVLVNSQPWTAQAFQCRQAWTGQVQNTIPDVKLTGSLRISPAIDPDGKLRIAKTILSSPSDTQLALAACLMPYSTYASQRNGSDTTTVNVPTDPIHEATARPAPQVPCNSDPTQLVKDANASSLQPNANPPYSTTADGSQVSVSGSLHVNTIDAEVIIGH